LFSKSHEQFQQIAAPKYLQRGKGCRVWDVDGNEYIDLTMAGGQVLLGYGYKEVDDAILSQLSEGMAFSLMHPLELEVAEIIHDTIPGAEGVRFNKIGSDVRNTAIRLSRAYTGRSKVLCCGSAFCDDQCDRIRHHPDSPFERCHQTFDYND